MASVGFAEESYNSNDLCVVDELGFVVSLTVVAVGDKVDSEAADLDVERDGETVEVELPTGMCQWPPLLFSTPGWTEA